MRIIFLLLVVAAVALVWLLFRNRHPETTAEGPHHGRSVVDEAASAMVDVADQLLGPRTKIKEGDEAGRPSTGTD